MDDLKVIPLEIPYLNPTFTAGNEAQQNGAKSLTRISNQIGVNHALDTQIFENRIEREWLSTEEAAHFLSVSENALRIMVHRGQIKAYKIGRRLRFSLQDCKLLFVKRGG